MPTTLREYTEPKEPVAIRPQFVDYIPNEMEPGIHAGWQRWRGGEPPPVPAQLFRLPFSLLDPTQPSGVGVKDPPCVTFGHFSG